MTNQIKVFTQVRVHLVAEDGHRSWIEGTLETGSPWSPGGWISVRTEGTLAMIPIVSVFYIEEIASVKEEKK